MVEVRAKGVAFNLSQDLFLKYIWPYDPFSACLIKGQTEP